MHAKNSYSRTLFRLLLVGCMLFCGNAFSQTAKITVTGNVVDSTNAKLNGVTVSARGKTNVTTTTDVNGKFVLDVEPGTILTFTMVGFVPQNVTATAEAKVFQIKLIPSKSDLTEVVITAMGKKQMKESVVGSVVSISPGKLVTPASNLTNAIVGQVAGVIGFQTSGQPGLDNSNFFVRGVTSFGYRQEPIILIDNIELTKDDLARLQVDDIESFSILKDASSTALYGSRGANGVILVTTKRGKSGRPRIDMRLDNVISEPTKMIGLTDPITYMNMYNVAERSRPETYTGDFFSADKIFNTQQTLSKAPGSNSFVYPAVDWMDLMFKKRTSNLKATASISGGGNIANYFVSGSYATDNGSLKRSPQNDFNNNVSFKTYQLRGNIDINLTKSTVFSVDLWGIFNDYSGPITSNASFATDLYSQATHTSPVLFAPYYEPDAANSLTQHILFGNGAAAGSTGSNAGLQYSNPYASMLRGFKTFSTSTMQATVKLDQKLDFITPGLSFNGFFNTNRYSYFDYQMAYQPFYYTVTMPAGYDRATNTYSLTWINNQPGQATEYLIYTPGLKDATARLHFQGSLNYNKVFDDHKIDFSLVGIRQQTLNSNGATLQSALPNRNLNLAGKLSYMFKNRYVVEPGFGYNGSERFEERNRFGFFPTVGAAWIVSREGFWKPVEDIITSFKLRASIGATGNDNIGAQRFFYLSDVDLQPAGAGAVFGANNFRSRPGVRIRNYPNPDVTWERSVIKNYAVEATFFRKLEVIAEYWQKNTKNILLQRLVPQSTGLEAPISANLGTASSQGVDLTANYTQTVNDLTVQIMSNFTYSKGKYTSFEEPNYAEYYRYVNGAILGQARGYIAERLFVDDNEAAAAPAQVFGGVVRGGDIKYRDLNNDGRITVADMAPIGFPSTPQISYGFGFSARYRAFDLSTRFQGQTRVSFSISPRDVSPFVVGSGAIGQTTLLQAFADDHWSFDNQNLYALYPRMGTNMAQIQNNMQPSTWWLRDGSFLRLKMAEVGYSMPQKLAQKIGLTKCRIYVSGSNLFNITNFKLWDVELGGNAFTYPIQRQFSLGLNVGI
ncbi:TonB-dependent receptor [Pedobacter frigoris]|uniref:SusC/RagA family TonB-linked outer membrane protein n=1 Tax=Pedobacter frigoris TaxID=2571272 RepID=UPI00292F7EA2|nr:TonB-dependent receptor [Pedobacter frigoris]